MTNQQSADLALQQWQALRSLPPDERIERLMADYFRPPIALDVRYQNQLNAVEREMSA